MREKMGWKQFFKKFLHANTLYKVFALALYLSGIVLVANLFLHLKYPQFNGDMDVPGSYMFEITYPPGDIKIAGLVLLLIGFYVVLDILFLYGKSWKVKIIPNILFLFLFFGVMEWGMDNLCKANPRMYRPNVYLIWELIPNVKVLEHFNAFTDKWGFRYADFPKEKEKNEFRIFVLGDSSAFGYNIPYGKRFSDILEEMLQEKYPNKKIRVVNAAVEGYSTFQMKTLFDMKISKLHPDFVILATNSDYTYDVEEDKDRLPPKFIRPFLAQLYKSKFYLLIRKLILNHRLRVNPHMHHNVFPQYAHILRVNEKDSFNFQVYMIEKTKQMGGVGGMIVAMPIPPKEVNNAIIRYRQIMKNASEKSGAIFIDINKVWKDDLRDPTMFIDNVHPTEKGHKKIAEELFSAMISHSIVK